MLWHAIDEGKLDKTCDFYLKLKSVKDVYPKHLLEFFNFQGTTTIVYIANPDEIIDECGTSHIKVFY